MLSFLSQLCPSAKRRLDFDVAPSLSQNRGLSLFCFFALTVSQKPTILLYYRIGQCITPPPPLPGDEFQNRFPAKPRGYRQRKWWPSENLLETFQRTLRSALPVLEKVGIEIRTPPRRCDVHFSAQTAGRGWVVYLRINIIIFLTVRS